HRVSCEQPGRPCIAKLVQATSPRIQPKDDEEENPLENLHAGAAQMEFHLQQVAAATDAAEKNRDENDRERILSSDECHENSRVPVSRGQAVIRMTVHRGHFNNTR